MGTEAALGSGMTDRLILVVGARRSGTNWVGRILATHPEVAYLPSETFLFAHLDAFAASFQSASMGSRQVGTFYVERPTLVRALRSFCDAMVLPVLDRAGPGHTRVLERTPDHSRNLALVSEVYPDARVVHIIRDGRDVARSLGKMGWGPGGARAGAQEWVESVGGARAAGSALEHYHEIRYEDLLAAPRASVKRLFDALGLAANDELVGAALMESEVPFNHDPSMPEIASEKWREGLSRRELDSVEQVAGDLLRELGYPATGSAVARFRRGSLPGALTRALARGLARAAAPLQRLRQPGTTETATQPDATEIFSELQWSQHTVDQFLEAVRRGRREQALVWFDQRAHVQTVQGGVSWEGRGPEAAAHLVDALLGDPVVMGSQTRSDVHPSQPAFTLVMCTGSGEELRSRTLVLFVRAQRIVRVAFYALR